MHWEEMWRFETAQFEIVAEITPSECPDLSWAGEEALRDYEDGKLMLFDTRVVVRKSGKELGADHLGESSYYDPKDFFKEHRNPDPQWRNTLETRAKGVCFCTYFPDMVRIAIAEARRTLA